MILTDREIKLALSKEQISIDPLPDEQAFSSTAVDLTLDQSGRKFNDTIQTINLDPGKPGYQYNEIIDNLQKTIAIDPNYTLENRELILGWTKEYVRLPTSSRLAARVEGKSSLARLGLGVHLTAPTIHAGFSGQLQLEIVNHGPAPITLRPGMKICQLVFELTLGVSEKAYAGVFSGQQSQ